MSWEIDRGRSPRTTRTSGRRRADIRRMAGDRPRRFAPQPTEGVPMGETAAVVRRGPRSPTVVFGAAVGVGAAVAVLAGVYGQVHEASREPTVEWFFTSTLHLKAW